MDYLPWICRGYGSPYLFRAFSRDPQLPSMSNFPPDFPWISSLDAGHRKIEPHKLDFPGFRPCCLTKKGRSGFLLQYHLVHLFIPWQDIPPFSCRG